MVAELSSRPVTLGASASAPETSAVVRVPDPILSEVPYENYVRRRGVERGGRHSLCSPRVWLRQQPPFMMPSIASHTGKRWGALATAVELEGPLALCAISPLLRPRCWPRWKPPLMTCSIGVRWRQAMWRAGTRGGLRACDCGEDESVAAGPLPPALRAFGPASGHRR